MSVRVRARLQKELRDVHLLLRGNLPPGCSVSLFTDATGRRLDTDPRDTLRIARLALLTEQARGGVRQV